MQVSQVSNQDGRMCAQLINLLNRGKWELSGPDIHAHAETVRWVQHVAGLMAADLKGKSAEEKAAPAATTPMKIKKMGSLPGSSAKKSK